MASPIIRTVATAALSIADELFTAAGLVDLAIHEERRKGRMCGVARKPSSHPEGAR